MVALFVLSALAPLALAAVFLYQEFDHSLQRTQQDNLNRDLRAFGMTVVTRLASADDALDATMQSGALGDAKLSAAISRMPWAAATRVIAHATVPPGSVLPALPDTHGRDWQQHRASLIWKPHGPIAPDLYLVRALGDGNTLWVEVSRSWLWRDAESFFPDDSLTVSVDGRGTIFQRAVALDNRPVLRGDWVLFLRTRFVADSWRFTIIEPRISSLEMLRGAQVVFPAIVAITILVVSLLAIGLIRRQMRPLEELVAGTRRIARRDFSAPIQIKGTDEFQGLARSFNEMTNNLRQQFAALEALSEIDRMLLQSAAIEDVLDTLLPKISRVLDCSAVSVLLTDEDSPEHVRVYDFCRGGPARPPVRRVAAPVALLEAACVRHELSANTLLDSHIGTLLEPLVQSGARSFALHALKTGTALSGILLIGYLDAAGRRREVAVRPSEFAVRLSVALDKIDQTTRLHHQAHFDALTGLANRRLFIERLAEVLAPASAAAVAGAVLYIDLDHFKRINDTEGHGAGDQLLRMVADRIKRCVGESGIAARLGGDEFAVLLPAVTDVEAVRHLAQQALKAIAEPITFKARLRHVSASIGIALFPGDASSAEELMMSSDVAMYRAKDLGRGQAVFFKAEMQRRLEAVAAIETGLHRALRDRQLRVLYQPIYASKGGRMRGAEALVRWPNAPGEPVRSPSTFIPVAEESGLIVELGAWVLHTSCRQFALWRQKGLRLEYVSVNVSVRQMVDPQLVETVRACLAQYDMKPSELQVEITETVLLDAAVTGVAIQALAAMGVRLALDDFGIGFSSLSYLRSYPIHTIKIDQSFIRDLPGSATACRLVEAMLAMAKAVERDVVAEGVETAEQREFLTAAGCESLQGYLLGRPMEAEDLRSFALASGSSTAVRVPARRRRSARV